MHCDLTNHSIRQINEFCRAYAFGGSRHPVYCNVEGNTSNVRVFRARSVKGELQIKDQQGRWVHPVKVYTI